MTKIDALKAEIADKNPHWGRYEQNIAYSVINDIAACGLLVPEGAATIPREDFDRVKEALEKLDYVREALKKSLLAITEIKAEVMDNKPVSGRSQASGDTAIQHLCWAESYIEPIRQALSILEQHVRG